MTLTNQRTRDVVALEYDNIKNWQSPNFVMLRCRITIGLPEVRHRIEPLQPLEVVRPTPNEVLAQAVGDAAVFIPGWAATMARVEALLADEERLDEWFGRRERDEQGVVLLPDPFEASPTPLLRIQIHIPFVKLVEAHRKVVERKRMESFDPLEDWPI